MLCPWNISNVDIINEVITVLISDAIGIKWLRSKAKRKKDSRKVLTTLHLLGSVSISIAWTLCPLFNFI